MPDPAPPAPTTGELFREIAEARRTMDTEATACPVFLLQQRQMHYNPVEMGADVVNRLSYDGDHYWFEPARDDDPEIECDQDIVDLEWGYWAWEPVSPHVWLTRAAAEEFGKATQHRYGGEGAWRVYAIPAGKDLEALLKAIMAHPAPQNRYAIDRCEESIRELRSGVPNVDRVRHMLTAALGTLEAYAGCTPRAEPTGDEPWTFDRGPPLGYRLLRQGVHYGYMETEADAAILSEGKWLLENFPLVTADDRRVHAFVLDALRALASPRTRGDDDGESTVDWLVGSRDGDLRISLSPAKATMSLALWNEMVERVTALRAAASRPRAEEDDGSVRCSCEWAHPVDGEIDVGFPAEIDPGCRVHGEPNGFPGPRPRAEVLRKWAASVPPDWRIPGFSAEYGPVKLVLLKLADEIDRQTSDDADALDAAEGETADD